MMALLGARKGGTEGRGRRAAGFVRAAVHAMVRNLLRSSYPFGGPSGGKIKKNRIFGAYLGLDRFSSFKHQFYEQSIRTVE